MEMIRELDLMQSDILRTVIGIMPPGPFTFDGLEKAFGRSISGAELRLALWRLHKCGIVHSFRKLSGERLYMVPLGMQMELLPLLAGLPDPVDESETIAADHKHVGKDVVMDMLTLLNRISSRPLKLSRKGDIPKGTVEEWVKALSLRPEAVQPLLNRKRLTAPYPPSVTLLLDIGLRSGLLEWQEGMLLTNEQRISAWLRLPDCDMHRYLHHYFLFAFIHEDPLIRAIVMKLFKFPEGRWMSWHNLKRTPDQSAAYVEELHVLRELGWVETGTSSTGETVFRTRFPASIPDHKPLYVQPDGELIVPSGESYRLHYLLSGLGKLLRNDRMQVYALTRESVSAALARGWSAETILSFLQNHSINGLPEQITSDIKEWENAFARFKFEPVTAIRFADKETADALASLSAMASLLTPESRLNATTFILEQEKEKQARKTLSELGLDAMPNLEDREKSSIDISLAWPGSHSGEPVLLQERDYGGIFHSIYATEAYAVVEPEKDAASLFPGLDSIPAAWLHELRAYHLSTLRSFVENAISWRCCVQIETCGKVTEFAPSRLMDDNSSRVIEGSIFGEPAAVRLTEIERIRLFIPGISKEKNSSEQ